MEMNVNKLRGKCTCGRDHTLSVREIIIGKDALKGLMEKLDSGSLSGYHHPVILCDENTLQAASGQIPDLLARVPVITLNPADLHANNQGVDTAKKGFEDLKMPCDLILALGSGTIHDLSRFLAYEWGIDFISCPTAASVDGFVSTVAAMTWNGMKATLPAKAPVCVVADTTVIARAPWRLTASGMADLFGKYTAIVDWEIAHAVTGEYYCERIARMEMDAIADVKRCMKDLRSTEPGKAEEAIASLMYALLLSGLAMQMVGNSRPASCAEHHMSHFWEMEVLNEHTDALHGEKVGVGLLEVTRVYKDLADHLRRGAYTIEPWRGLEMDRIEASFGKKGLLNGVIAENTPDPMADITPALLKSRIPEIVRIIDEDLPSVQEIDTLLMEAGCCRTMADIGLPESLIPDSLTLSPYVRNRLSFNRLRKMIRTVG